MLASTNRLTASPEFGATPSVSTWVVVPANTMSAAACAVTVPAELDLKLTVQTPFTVPVVAQLSCRFSTTAPLAGVSVTVAFVPSGAGNVVSRTDLLTWTVKVCVAPTSFTALGAMLMLPPQTWKPSGGAKSLSSAVKDWELRVLPNTVEMHGVSANRPVTSTPISVKAFGGSKVIWLPCLSKFGHGPPSMLAPLLNAQIVSVGVQPSPVSVPCSTYWVPFHSRTVTAPMPP